MAVAALALSPTRPCRPSSLTVSSNATWPHPDGRVVATLTYDVAAGTELCNSYCDIELPFAGRQRELLEYGFVCDCVRCERERKATPPAAAGKRRLK